MTQAARTPYFFGIAYAPERGPVPFDYSSGAYSSNPGIIGPDGTTLVGCDEYNVFDSPEAAKRITDCLNALEGIPDPSLVGGND